MTLIPVVGRRSPKMRALIGFIYLLLTAGALTTVYPFVVMLGASVTSDYDENAYTLIPAYLNSDSDLVTKYAEDKYNSDLIALNHAYGAHFATLQTVSVKHDPGAALLVSKWRKFMAQQDAAYRMAGFRGPRGQYVPSKLLTLYRNWLREKYRGDINRVAVAYTEEDTSFDSVFPPFERPLQRFFSPANTAPKDRDWQEFQKQLPENWFQPVLCDPLYQSYLHDEAYPSGKIDDLNKAWGTSYTDWTQIELAPSMPSNPTQGKDWATFVRRKLPLRFIGWNSSAPVRGPSAPITGDQTETGGPSAPITGDQEKKRDLPRLATRSTPPDPLVPRSGKGSRISSAPITGDQERGQKITGKMPVPQGPSAPIMGDRSASGLLPTGPALRKYAAFVATADPRWIRVDSIETRWRTQVGNPRAALPLAEDDREYALANASAIRQEFLSRNYKFALNFLLLHGRGIWNTLIYCAGAVLAAIIINPLCAYALSRFRLPYATNLLLFLLGTMAFPAEITMIPNFLLIKQLGLLNTFWALILPAAASGYSIFLLKGFFDSLPPELYEAGMLDGASEITLFTRVTLPLSGPIFAVIALNAFASAYGAFLFAMVVAQAQDHWTLMVWIYELQALSAPQYVIMAALVIAALPTLIVFLFAQNVIMKGIILPSYK